MNEAMSTVRISVEGIAQVVDKGLLLAPRAMLIRLAGLKPLTGSDVSRHESDVQGSFAR